MKLRRWTQPKMADPWEPDQADVWGFLFGFFFFTESLVAKNDSGEQLVFQKT